MEVLEYYDPQANKEVKKFCGIVFIKGRPTRVFDDTIVKRAMRAPAVFRIVDKSDEDRQAEKAAMIKQISLAEAVKQLEERQDKVDDALQSILVLLQEKKSNLRKKED